MKVGVVGAGGVGATAAFAMVLLDSVAKVVLVDRDEARAAAQAQDILHAVPFAPYAAVRAASFDGLVDAAAVVIAAGANQRPGQSRLDLIGHNVAVFADVVPRILAVAPDAVLLVASNPVDVMTQVAARLAGIAPGRVIGSGTILDTARFRALLGGHLSISSSSVHAYVLGEHGDSEVLQWSGATAGGVPVDAFASQVGRPLDDVVRGAIDAGVRGAAAKIIAGKGYTAFGIAGGLARLVSAMRNDDGAVLTCSMLNEDVVGVPDVALSLPRIVGRGGVTQSLMPELNADERAALRRSAEVLKAAATEAEAALR